MKRKTTNKYINSNYKKVFRSGYCDLYPIVVSDPVYYNCGLYGWNYDAYVNYKYDICITTGYRNMTGARIPGEILKKYKLIAENALTNNASIEDRYLIECEFFNELNEWYLK